ncbi:hypothetical protein [Muricomes intestini]|uniref:hypothetical protein n=1 Tax=Muricomes intestini TaxID=1796634 RepID=UPI002FE36B46
MPFRNEFANIRDGIFTGFGGRVQKYPLLETGGVELETDLPRDFGKYHRVMVWEEDPRQHI